MKDAFKVKKGLNVQPTDPAEVVNPEAGDIIVDSTDDNRLKVYDPTSSEFAAVGTGGSSGNILSDIEKLTPTVSNVVAVTDTTTFLPIDDNNKSVKATFSGSDGSIRYEGPASADLDGVQGVVKVWIKTDVEGLSLVATKDGVAQNNGLTINSTNKWRQYEIPVVLGDADYGFEIQASGAVSGDVYIDESVVKVERVLQQFDTTITDWVEFTPVLKGFTSDPSLGSTSVNRAYYRRVGDSLEFRAEIQQTSAGSPGSGNYYFELPNNLQADLDKIQASATTGLGTVGSASARIASGNYEGTASVINNNGVSIYIGNAGTNTSYVGSSYLSTSNSEWRLSFEATIPIQGWSSETSTIVTQDTELTAKTANEFSFNMDLNGNVTQDSYDFINGNCTKVNQGGYYQYNCPLNDLGITEKLQCAAMNTNGAGLYLVGYRSAASSTSQISFTTQFSNSNTILDAPISAVCRKADVDLNKSATIVGKFENINSTSTNLIEAFGNSGETITSSVNIPWTYKVTDSEGLWDGTGLTLKKDACYSFDATVRTNSSDQQSFRVYIDNVITDYVKVGTAPYTIHSFFFNRICAQEGEKISFRYSSGSNILNNSGFHRIIINEVPESTNIVKNLSDQKTKCQTKVLSADVTSTGIMNDLTFTNLTAGKKYSIAGHFYSQPNGASGNKYTFVLMGGVTIPDKEPYYLQGDYPNEHSPISIPRKIFTSTGVDVYFQISAISGYTVRSGEHETWVQLCELPDTYVETTEF